MVSCDKILTHIREYAYKKKGERQRDSAHGARATNECCRPNWVHVPVGDTSNRMNAPTKFSPDSHEDFQIASATRSGT